jgi:RNA ligase (TIGR02306 family)
MIDEKTSTHKCEVVHVDLNPHPNADTLSIVNVWGYTVVVKTADFLNCKLGAYIVPDSVIDTDRKEFAHVKDGEKRFLRIKVRKLRGVISMGLLVPAPKGACIGDDVSDILEVKRYEPPYQSVVTTGGNAERPFNEEENERFISFPKYDLDAFLRYAKEVFIDGEPVHVTEKLDGSNSRYVFSGNRMWCGSRSHWKKYRPDSIWWVALEKAPALEEFCKENPNIVVYGEVFGNNPRMPYARQAGDIRFAAFDILKDGVWMNVHEAKALAKKIPWVPVVADIIPYNFEKLVSLAEGKSLFPGANHMKEGVVVTPLIGRWHKAVGRVKLKIVGNGYYQSKSSE